MKCSPGQSAWRRRWRRKGTNLKAAKVSAPFGQPAYRRAGHRLCRPNWKSSKGWWPGISAHKPGPTELRRFVPGRTGDIPSHGCTAECPASGCRHPRTFRRTNRSECRTWSSLWESSHFRWSRSSSSKERSIASVALRRSISTNSPKMRSGSAGSTAKTR